MDINELFNNWYKTKGVRYLLPKDVHWHEGYTRAAFEAGFNTAINEYLKAQERSLKIHGKLISQIQTTINKIK